MFSAFHILCESRYSVNSTVPLLCEIKSLQKKPCEYSISHIKLSLSFEVLIKYSDYRRIPLFIEAVADWYVENLADDYKEYLTEHPNIEDYWDTLCLHIRNEFLYPQKYLIEQEIKRMKECNDKKEQIEEFEKEV